MNLIKKILGKYKFKSAKEKYYKSLKKIRLTDPLEVRTLETLENEGFVVIHNWLDDKSVDLIRSQVSGLLENVRPVSPDENLKYWAFKDFGVYRLLDAYKHSEASKVFFDSLFIKSISQAYVSRDAIGYQKMAEIRPDVAKESIADGVHFDDWKIRFKAFLYLSDVDEASAPFCYYPGSHKHSQIRERKELEYFLEGKAGSYGYYSSSEIDEISKKFNLSKVSCVGKKGSLILVDTRGLHSGTPLRNPNNPRVLLATYYDIR